MELVGAEIAGEPLRVTDPQFADEDPGALKFLSAAEDQPPSPPPAPGAFTPPPHSDPMSAAPSDTPEQSKMPSGPATIGLQAMVSLETSLRNWARGLSAPFLWFFQAMRVSTSFISSGSTPYFLA